MYCGAEVARQSRHLGGAARCCSFCPGASLTPRPACLLQTEQLAEAGLLASHIAATALTTLGMKKEAIMTM